MAIQNKMLRLNRTNDASFLQLCHMFGYLTCEEDGGSTFKVSGIACRMPTFTKRIMEGNNTVTVEMSNGRFYVFDKVVPATARV